jgi:hypothetical protein
MTAIGLSCVTALLGIWSCGGLIDDPRISELEAGIVDVQSMPPPVSARTPACDPTRCDDECSCPNGESCYSVCGEIGRACFVTGTIQPNGCPSIAQECLATDAGTGCSIR